MKKLENPNPLSGPSPQAGDPDLLIPSEESAPEILDLVRFTIDPLLQFRHLGKNFEEITGFTASGFVNFSSSFFTSSMNPTRASARRFGEKLRFGLLLFAMFRLITSAGVKSARMRGPAISGGGSFRSRVISEISAQKEADATSPGARIFRPSRHLMSICFIRATT